MSIKYQEALAYYQSMGMPFNVGLTYQRLGFTAEGLGDAVQAREYYEAALVIFDRIGSPSSANVRANLAALDEEEPADDTS